MPFRRQYSLTQLAAYAAPRVPPGRPLPLSCGLTVVYHEPRVMRRFNDDAAETMTQCLVAGLSIRRTAEVLGVSPSSVVNWRKRLGHRKS
jgi:transposase-like protein